MNRTDLTRLTPVLMMTVGLWTTAFTLLTTLLATVGQDPDALRLVFPRALAFCAGALLCGGLALGLHPFSNRSLLVQLPFALAASIATAVINGAVSDFIFGFYRTSPATSPWLTAVLARAYPYVWIFLAWCCAYLAMTYSERSRRNELRLIEAQALTADAQNRMLRYQINPHFLFNTLNALQTLMSDRKVAQAKQMVLSLADFLRYSLALSPDEKVSLGEEVEAQAAYLAIEQARFGARLNVVFEVAPDVTGARVPSLILQPLVENAVKYAVAPSRDTVTIRIAAAAEGDRLRIEVSDDGGAGSATPPSLGLGLENVRRRLDLASEGQAEFSFGTIQPRGFRVAMALPLERI